MLSIRQLRKRKVAQWVLGYTALAWALLQGIDLLSDTYGWSATPRRVGVALAVLGFFVALIVSWYQGERGVQKVTRLEVVLILGVVALGAGWLWQTLGSSTATSVASASAADAGIPTIEKDPSIAVLPLENMSTDKEQQS